MNIRFLLIATLIGLLAPHASLADPQLMSTHCQTCHDDADPEGDFSLSSLGREPGIDNLEFWLKSLERVKAREMPPADDSDLDDPDRAKLIAFLKTQLGVFKEKHKSAKSNVQPRRMNNREFANSVADVLLIDDIGTHLPTDNLIGDSRHHGFDTHSATLGFSKFHLEQYIKSVRAIVDATILSGRRPSAISYSVSPEEIHSETTSQNTNRQPRSGTARGFDFLDPKQLAYFGGFENVPTTGWYRIKVRCRALNRGTYDEEDTGIYDADPIQIRMIMGDRQKTFDLPDDEAEEIELEEWLAAGTRFRLQYPTDGLTLVGNGNFKFQNRITAKYFKENKPARYRQLVRTFPTKKRNGTVRRPDDWHNWVDHWMGPRPRILRAAVEGPFFKAWPPERQVALLGEKPSAADARSILRPIAERAWRRKVRTGELDDIVSLVQSKSADLGHVEALKEGIVAILVSPEFLLLNGEDETAAERFATKFSMFLSSTIPSSELRETVTQGKLDSFAQVRDQLRSYIKAGKANAFLKAFPYAWLELNDINFMAPDPDHFRLYHRKRISEDMVAEALQFFRHIVEEDRPLPELLLANYSFINADLATVYGVEDGPKDSNLHRYEFKDGRRGGLLGMGAFLTSTADSLSTSPIHRAVYVMENFLDIEPTPPPADVEITEPDVRQATTIKEVLQAHASDKSCASCHQKIDPFGYAFENFGPDGSWRDVYTVQNEGAKPEPKRARRKAKTIPIDASASFANGNEYSDILSYRRLMDSPANRERFVRCFVRKLLTYANGVEPATTDFAEIDRIVEKSAEHDYRTVETVAAVIDSKLFRDRQPVAN